MGSTREIQDDGTESKRLLIESIAKSTVFANFAVSLFRNLIYSIKFYGKEKHNAKILSTYLSKFDEKAQNCLSIKLHVKWSVGELGRFIAWNTLLYNISLLNGFLYLFVTSILKTMEEQCEK